ncbi:biotin--[acetyl-CoA-carboxylase] ligase [Sphingomonas sp. RRHST34]|uniref:biotin--[biotin carboxyl-carrier protein] ligase n=1 Tax=Sphingomonas citri TaxID=2862499 RepID=A0ABS7BR80_9SPHN|nr:biotin--[acetyl-CoA-carboxylase] ligase [Sphingomonas citri]MBW6532089.1 biotin--[acetyl-CoA-carboxylase] ligase [Sphingomonas citri]
MTRTLHVPETGSTNADLRSFARDGYGEHGLWLRADRQTAGRGREGRAWDSPVGNLYASTLVRLAAGDPPAPTLALVAAVALEETVRAALPDAAALRLKWPNDLLLDGAKLSGILLERVDEWVVIGFGVNVAHHPELADRATTSLCAAGATSDAATLQSELAATLAHWHARWREEGLGPVAERWRERAHPPGTELRARLPDGGEWHGRYETLDPGGALVLRLADGSRRVMHAGDIFLL